MPERPSALARERARTERLGLVAAGIGFWATLSAVTASSGTASAIKAVALVYGEEEQRR